MPWNHSASRKASLKDQQHWDPVAPWVLQKPFPLRPQFPHLPNTEGSVWPGFLLGGREGADSKSTCSCGGWCPRGRGCHEGGSLAAVPAIPWSLGRSADSDPGLVQLQMTLSK